MAPTDIQGEDVFIFRGLTKDFHKDGPELRLVVRSITVGGVVVFRIEGVGEGTQFGQAPLSEALLMIRQGIWEKVED
jgi:hypothetical protein